MREGFWDDGFVETCRQIVRNMGVDNIVLQGDMIDARMLIDADGELLHALLNI